MEALPNPSTPQSHEGTITSLGHYKVLSPTCCPSTCSMTPKSCHLGTSHPSLSQDYMCQCLLRHGKCGPGRPQRGGPHPQCLPSNEGSHPSLSLFIPPTQVRSLLWTSKAGLCSTKLVTTCTPCPCWGQVIRGLWGFLSWKVINREQVTAAQPLPSMVPSSPSC